MSTAGTLEITTPTDRDIVMTRLFAAPRHLVYRAYTTPELLKRWLGVFGKWSLAVCEIDLRAGGSFRYVWRDQAGREMGMRGTYREVVPDTRLVSTEIFDDPWYEGEALATVTFAEHAGRTTLTMTMQYGSKEIRDGILKSGMQDGVAKSFDMLEALLSAN
jgi:uncharacterized protein YndB with AHSA1/START domain